MPTRPKNTQRNRRSSSTTSKTHISTTANRRDLTRALQALTDGTLAGLPLGRHEIEGDAIFALVQEYETKPREGVEWEAHRRYIDVQYVESGSEAIGWAPLASLQVTQEYKPEKDVLRLAGPGDFVTLGAEQCAVLYPPDAHMPGRAPTGSRGGAEDVIKVKVE